MSSNRSSKLRARLRACCTVHSPVGFAVTPPRCIRRVPCSMNTRTCSLLRSTVSTCRKSTATIPAAWACRNCRQPGPERRGAGSMPAACRISHTVEGATVTPSFVSSPWIRRCPHSGFSFARRTTRRAMPGTRRRAPWLAPLARVVLLRRQPAVPGQQRRWRHGEDFGPAPARYKPRQGGEPGPVGRLVPHPAGVPPQYRVLVPEHQQLSILRQVAAEDQDGQAEYPAREQVDDLEQHPASQPSPRQACWRKRRSATQSSIRAVQATTTARTRPASQDSRRTRPPMTARGRPPIRLGRCSGTRSSAKPLFFYCTHDRCLTCGDSRGRTSMPSGPLASRPVRAERPTLA